MSASSVTRRESSLVRFSGLVVRRDDATSGEEQSVADPQFICYGSLSKQSQKMVAVRDSLRTVPLLHVGMFFTVELRDESDADAVPSGVEGPYVVVLLLGWRPATLTDALLYERLMCTGLGATGRPEPPLSREYRALASTMANTGANTHLGALVASSTVGSGTTGGGAAARGSGGGVALQQRLVRDLAGAFALERDYGTSNTAPSAPHITDLVRLLSLDEQRAACISYAELAALARYRPQALGDAPSLEFLFPRALLPLLSGAARHRALAVTGIYVSAEGGGGGIMPPASRLEATYGTAHALLAYRLFRVVEFFARTESRDAPAVGSAHTPRSFTVSEIEKALPKKLRSAAPSATAEALAFLCNSRVLELRGAAGRYALAPDCATARRIWRAIETNQRERCAESNHWRVRFANVPFDIADGGVARRLLSALGFVADEIASLPVLVLRSTNEVRALIEHAQIYDDNASRHALELALHYRIVLVGDAHLLRFEQVADLLDLLYAAAQLHVELFGAQNVVLPLHVVLCGDTCAYGSASTFATLFQSAAAPQQRISALGAPLPVQVPSLQSALRKIATAMAAGGGSGAAAAARDELVAKLRSAALLEFGVTVLENTEALARRIGAEMPRRFIVLGSPDAAVGHISAHTDALNSAALLGAVSGTLQTLLFCKTAPFIGYAGYCCQVQASWLLAKPPRIGTALSATVAGTERRHRSSHLLRQLGTQRHARGGASCANLRSVVSGGTQRAPASPGGARGGLCRPRRWWLPHRGTGAARNDLVRRRDASRTSLLRRLLRRLLCRHRTNLPLNSGVYQYASRQLGLAAGRNAQVERRR
jgi:hypothetical protein